MEKLIGVEDIALLVGVKKSTIYQWTHLNRIPVVRLSARCIKFSEAAIVAWLEEKSFVPGQQSQLLPPPPKKRKTRATENISSARIEDIVARAKKEVLKK